MAAIIAAGAAGCSGSRSLIPAAGGIAGPAAHLSPRFEKTKNQAPDYMQLAFLMTDGSVLAQGESNWGSWYKYVPDASGSYADGTWTQVASLPSGYAPDAYASTVLPDGRLLISGGEYNIPGNYDLQLVNLGAIYDPLKNTWTKIGHPNGWGFIGDSPAILLPNGLFLMGDKLMKEDATFNPATDKWQKLSSKNNGKADFNAEEGWTLLPNGTVLTADVLNAPNSEIYDPATNKWTSAGSTVVDLRSQSPYHSCLQYGPKQKDCYLPPGEIGPAMLMYNGTVYATGSGQGGSGFGTGHTAVYNVAGGTWTAGPDFPNGDNAGDSFAVLEPNGKVLVFGVSGEMYEWNGSTLTGVGSEGGPPLLLPTGQVAMFGSNVDLYTPSGSSKSSWAPAITKATKSLKHGKTYSISGTQFNGLSQAVAFGDEYQNGTSYPLVRITNTKSGHVFYARTHDENTAGIAPGQQVTVKFDVPAKIDTGAGTLVVVANGIPSASVSVTVK
ncbi:MAG TPA: hypothetical protein VHX17_13310 [Candidatus Cybelea sp.]|nr:hypothetical protein [Candidatus Cybelea sp.]